MLVGENPETFPSSKATTSETNLSTSTRPRPATSSSSGGGKYVLDRVLAVAQSPVYSRRRRRQIVSNSPTPTHDSMLSAPLDADPYFVSENTTSHPLVVLHDHNNDSLVVTSAISSEHVESTTVLHDARQVNVSEVSLTTISVLSAESDTNHQQQQQHLHQQQSELTNVTSTASTTISSSSSVNPSTESIVDNYSSESTQFSTTTDGSSSSLSPSTESSVDILSSTASTEYISSIKSSTTYDLSTKSYEELLKDMDDVIKITEKDSPETESPKVLEIHDKPKPLPESHSMKTAENESPQVIQHDYPIFAYGSDEVEIVRLHNDPVSTTVKSRDSYNSGVQKKSPDKNLLDNDVKHQSEKGEEPANKTIVDDSSSAELQTSNLAPVKKLIESAVDAKPKINMHESDSAVIDTDSSLSNNHESVTNKNPNPLPKVQLVEIPDIDTVRHSKRVFVNVTIAAEPDSENPERNSQPFYVLSVSVPTDGNPNNFPGINIGNFNPPPPAEALVQQSTTNSPSTEVSSSTTSPPPPPAPGPWSPSTTSRHYNFWGGECQCSCPCLEDSKATSDLSSTLTPTSDQTTDTTVSLALNASSTTPPYTDAELLSDGTSDDYNNTKYLSSSTEGWSSDADDDVMSTTEPSTGWSSSDSSACPGVTTALPPPPTILILEGRDTSQ